MRRAAKIDANQTEIQFATAMAKTISDTLKIKNRGVKSEILSHRGRLGILHITNNSILIEVCFISNKRDNFTKFFLLF